MIQCNLKHNYLRMIWADNIHSITHIYLYNHYLPFSIFLVYWIAQGRVNYIVFWAWIIPLLILLVFIAVNEKQQQQYVPYRIWYWSYHQLQSHALSCFHYGYKDKYLCIENNARYPIKKFNRYSKIAFQTALPCWGCRRITTDHVGEM